MVEDARGFHFECLRPTRLPSRSHRSFPSAEMFGPNSVPWICPNCKCPALLTTEQGVSSNQLHLLWSKRLSFTKDSLRCRRLKYRQPAFLRRGTAQSRVLSVYDLAPQAPNPPRPQ